MQWFRSRIRFGTRLALFAFAIQIALSFGHVHADGLVAHSSKSAVSASAAVPAGIGDPIRNGLADFDCPICALIQMVSASAPATAPTMALPAMVTPLWLEAPSAVALTGPTHRAFEARAPPVA